MMRVLAWIVMGMSLVSCTHFAVDDCNEPGGSVLGEDVPRIRSAGVRMKLADSALAARRFLPYAAMSALAYAEDVDCGHPPRTVQRATAMSSRRSCRHILRAP
jgi:hypothetical protein